MELEVNGIMHQLTKTDSFVTSYRKKVYSYMTHLFHICVVCETEPVAMHIFDVWYINAARKNRYDELIRWQPSAEEYEAWDKAHSDIPIKQREIDDFIEELDQMGVNWDEL